MPDTYCICCYPFDHMRLCPLHANAAKLLAAAEWLDRMLRAELEESDAFKALQAAIAACKPIKAGS